MTLVPQGGQNEGMVSPASKPFQFDLASIFLATSVVALAMGLLYWFGSGVMILVVQTAVIAVLAKRRRTAWMDIAIFGVFFAFPCLFSDRRSSDWFLLVAFWLMIPGLVVMRPKSGAEPNCRSRSLRWSWLLPYVWLVAFVMGMMISNDWRAPGS